MVGPIGHERLVQGRILGPYIGEHVQKLRVVSDVCPGMPVGYGHAVDHDHVELVHADLVVRAVLASPRIPAGLQRRGVACIEPGLPQGVQVGPGDLLAEVLDEKRQDLSPEFAEGRFARAQPLPILAHR